MSWRIGSLFWLARGPIRSLFHKMLGPYFYYIYFFFLQRIRASRKSLIVPERKLSNGRRRQDSCTNWARKGKRPRKTMDCWGAGCHEEAWRDHHQPSHYFSRLGLFQFKAWFSTSGDVCLIEVCIILVFGDLLFIQKVPGLVPGRGRGVSGDKRACKVVQWLC